MARVAIIAAARTAIGKFEGSLSSLSAQELGAHVLGAVIERSGVEAEAVEETVMGQVLTAGQGQNPVRQAHLLAGLPQQASAWGVSQVCGSGLRSVMLAAQQILLGQAQVVLAGGQESMSRAPHVSNLRQGHRLGNVIFTDTLQQDALTDGLQGYAMGVTAETIAARWKISREEQDDFAWESHAKASAAQSAGLFEAEIVPLSLSTRLGVGTFAKDEPIRFGLERSALKKLQPAFQDGGTVTAGNASGLNDGAAAVLLVSEEEAQRRALKPMAYIAAFATAGVDPTIMGIGPVAASRRALAHAGWSVADLDSIEANEAFAAQAIAVNREMGWDVSKVNPNGGAIALGHPIGASGARVLTTLLFQLQRRGGGRGLATLCIGGGMGVSLCIETP